MRLVSKIGLILCFGELACACGASTHASESTGADAGTKDAGTRVTTKDAGTRVTTKDAGTRVTTKDAGTRVTTKDAGTHVSTRDTASTEDAGTRATMEDAGTHAHVEDARAAGLDGSTVTATLYNPDLAHVLGGPATAVVGASDPTFPKGKIVGNTTFQIDVTSNQIIYNPLTNVTYSNGTFNGFVFDFANAPTILGVTLDPASNFTPTKISFTGNSVSMNLSGNAVTTGSVAILDVQLAP